MALTKVSGGILDPGINVAGIVTATGFDGPFVGGSSKNIIAGIVTATGLDLNGSGDISGNLVVHGNLTANGDFTTLNTTLREVELFRVDANSSAAAGIITQRGAGDALAVDFDYGSNVIQRAFTIHKGNTYGELVGIGTDNPGTILHIQDEYTAVYPFNSPVAGFLGAIRYPNELVLENAVAGVDGSWTGIMFRSGANSSGSAHGNARISAVQTADNQADLAFSTRSGTFGERIRITGAGLVGIGTTVPTTALDVRGVVTATQGAVVTGIVTATSFTASDSGVTGQYTRNQIIWDRNSYNYIDCSNDSGQFAFRMGSSQTVPFSIDTNADTTFPNERKLKFGSNTSHQLHIYHTVSGSSQHIIESNSNTNHLVLKATTIGPRADNFNFRNYASSATVFSIDADDATTLYFNSTPRLETQTSRVVIRGSSGLGVYGETGANNDGHVTVHPTGNAVYSRIQFYNAAGNSYAQVFAHAGQTLFLDSANNGQINYRANGTGDHIFQNNGQETLRILDSGNVGIGTDNPGNLLEVYGTAAATVVEVNGTGRYRGYEIHESGTRKAYFHHDATNNEAILNTAEATLQFHTGDTPRMKLDGNGDLTFKDGSAQGNSLQSMIRVTDSSDNVQYEFGMLSTGNEDLYIKQNRNANLRFQTNGSTRWKIDGTGHLLPETAGAVNIGSASVGIGSVFLPDDKRISFGNDEDLQISHSSGNVSYIISPTNRQLQYKSDGGFLIRGGGNQMVANFLQSAVTLYQSQTIRLTTTSTGITVGGEVAATQDYPDFKPALDLNFVQNQTLDPRITYSRVGTASFTDENGRLRWVGSHVPRFDHEPGTGKPRGLLVEAAGTNLMKAYGYFYNQNIPASSYFSNTNGAAGELSTDILAPDGSNLTFKVHWPNGYAATHNGYVRVGNGGEIGTLTSGDYAFSFFVKRGTDGAHNLDDLLANNEPGLTTLSFTAQDFSPYYAPSVAIRTDTNSDMIIEKYPDGWYRISNILFNANQTWSPNNTGVSHYVLASSAFTTYYEAHAFYYWGFQLEKNPVSTSYIGMTVQEQTTRAADSAVIEGENFDEFFNHNGAENNDYQGTLIASVESAAASSPSAGRFNKIQLEQNNDNKVQLCVVGGGSPYYDSHITYGTATQSDFTGSQGSTFPTVIKHGVAFAKNNAAYSYNGNTVETDTSVNVGGVSTATHGKYTQLTIGLSPTKAHIKRVMYYSQRISNTQLRNLTS